MRRRQKTLATKPTGPTEYPAGSFIKTERGYFYIVGPGKRFHIVSLRALNSWAPPRVIATTEAAVAKYRISSKLRFRDGSLIHNLSDGKIYLIEKGSRRQIISPDALERIGAVWDDAVTVSPNEINLHEEGKPLS